MVSEKRFGLGSLLWIRCSCGELNRIPTGKCHKANNKGVPIYDVNSKAAAAMLHAGISQTAVERFTSTIQIPSPNRKIVKCRERELGPVIEDVAKTTCKIA